MGIPFQLSFVADDPPALAQFWALALGKPAKNRLHLDIDVGAPDHDWANVLAHVERLRKAGATVVEHRSDEMSRWVVLLETEGNEFCVQ